MSDPLTESAPADDSADLPVGTQAADEEVAADEASGHDEKTIPVERFNGLMSKFNKTQEELAQARSELEAVKRQLTSQLAEDNQGEPEPVADVADLEAKVSALTELLLTERGASTKEKLLAKYPDAAPFADLINIDPTGSVEEYEGVVSEVARIVQTLKGETDTGDASAESSTSEETTESTESEPEPIIQGAGTGQLPPDGPANADDKVAEALKSKDFAAFLRAKTEKVHGQSDGLVLTS